MADQPTELASMMERRKTWSNVSKNHKATPLGIFSPQSLADLILLLKTAKAEKQPIRAVGSGHSYSDVALTNGYVIDPKGLKPFAHVISPEHYGEKQRFKPSAKPKENVLVEVSGNMILKDLNKWLHKQKLALTNMGAVDLQTLAGAISTGTHGTGRRLGAFPSMVRSILILGGNGQLYRIEPTVPITREDKLKPETISGVPVTLIANDEWFNSALMTLGSMGIIYSYILEVEPSYKLAETKEVWTWEGTKDTKGIRTALLDGSLFFKKKQAARHVTINLAPYSINPWKKVHNAIRTIQVYDHQVDRRDKNHKLLWVNAMVRNLAVRIGSLLIPASAIELYLDVFPKGNPKVISKGFLSVKDKLFIGPSHKVLHQGNASLKKHGYSAEFAFPLGSVDELENGRAEGVPRFIQAVERVWEVLEELGKDSQLFLTSPLTVRFVKASKAYLSPMYHEHANGVTKTPEEAVFALFDLPTLYDSAGAKTILNRLQKEMLAFGGVPHWGKVNNMIDARWLFTSGNYPNLDSWLKVFDTLNPRLEGKSERMLDNAFTRRMGFSQYPDEKLSEFYVGKAIKNGIVRKVEGVKTEE